MTYSAGVRSVATRRGDVVLTVADVANAVSQAQLANALAGLSVSAGNVASVEFAHTGVNFPETQFADTQQSFLAFQITDPTDQSDALLLSIEFKDVSGIGTKFSWSLWEKDPLTDPANAKIVFKSPDHVITGSGTYNTDFKFAATSYIPNSLARNGLYLVIVNELSSPITLGFKLDFLKLPPITNPIVLPDYTGSSFTYTGPNNLTTLEVGPGQTFPEPADALPHAAPGFVMNVHPGTYYRAIHIPSGMDGFVIQAAGGGNADTVKFNGRGGWVTGYPLWTDDGPPGSGPVNPYRLARGKGWVHTESPGTIKGIGFWYCGGAYGKSVKDANGVEINTGDAEAGIYAENFLSPGTLTVDHCTFDGNENGIFIPHPNTATDPAASQGTNITLHLTYCDFSATLANGLSTDGLSHNVYISCAVINVDHCNFFDCNGNSFKSRAPVVNMSNCFLMQGAGRAIDYPDGGTLTVSNTVFSQRTWGAGQTRIHNFIGVNNESPGNSVATCTFTNCTTHIGYAAAFFTHYGPTLTWSGTTEYWYQPPGSPNTLDVAFGYDTEHGSDTTSVVGDLVWSPPTGTTFIQSWPLRNTTLYHLL